MLRQASGDVVVVATVPTIEGYMDIREFAVDLHGAANQRHAGDGPHHPPMLGLDLRERLGDRVDRPGRNAPVFELPEPFGRRPLADGGADEADDLVAVSDPGAFDAIEGAFATHQQEDEGDRGEPSESHVQDPSHHV